MIQPPPPPDLGLAQIEKGELPPEIVKKIAKRLSSKNLKIEEKDVIEMNRRLLGPEKSLNSPISIDNETEKITLLKSNEENQENKLDKIDEKNVNRQLQWEFRVGFYS